MPIITGYLRRLRLRQEYSAVSGACLLIRRSIFMTLAA